MVTTMDSLLTFIQYIVNLAIDKGTQSMHLLVLFVHTTYILQSILYQLSCYCTLGTATYIYIIYYSRGAHH